MRCGAKCFHVTREIAGKTLVESVNVRTPAEARKSIRNKYGANTSIISVKRK